MFPSYRLLHRDSVFCSDQIQQHVMLTLASCTMLSYFVVCVPYPYFSLVKILIDDHL